MPRIFHDWLHDPYGQLTKSSFNPLSDDRVSHALLLTTAL